MGLQVCWDGGARSDGGDGRREGKKGEGGVRPDGEIRGVRVAINVGTIW